ncbi:MAG: hypothetical protein LQ346_000448 [Caloplaca aetnensis]|nr:MAG: hypothetical protein LQ346_000448 [Caloplaca aetnensis]
MKVSNFLLVPLVTVLPAIVSGTCYGSGLEWDREKAINAVDKACKALVGNYPGGQAKVSNINVKPGNCYHFVLRRLGGTNKSIALGECKSGMLHEVTGCQRGGSTGYDNWAYIADPNQGVCPKKARRNQVEEDYEDVTDDTEMATEVETAE